MNFQDYTNELKSTKSNISCDQKQDAEFDLYINVLHVIISIYISISWNLLYHGLGSERRFSIALAEGMKSDKRIFIMTPASLKMNFFSELKKCGDLMYKKNQFWNLCQQRVILNMFHI